MRCFTHPEVDAVALCKHCGKALCRECVVESEAGVSCAGKCAAHVSGAHEVLKQSKKALGQTGRTYLTNAIFFVAIGLAFLGFGFALDMTLLHVMGIVFVLWGVLTYRVGQKMQQA